MPDVTFRCEVRFTIEAGQWLDVARIVLPTRQILTVKIIAGDGGRESGLKPESGSHPPVKDARRVQASEPVLGEAAAQPAAAVKYKDLEGLFEGMT